MKYLITQEQLSRLQNLSMPRHLMEELDELKPIEPLSDETIGLISTEPMFCGCHPDFCQMVVRIVEAHILGDKHDS